MSGYLYPQTVDAQPCAMSMGLFSFRYDCCSTLDKPGERYKLCHRWEHVIPGPSKFSWTYLLFPFFLFSHSLFLPLSLISSFFLYFLFCISFLISGLGLPWGLWDFGVKELAHPEDGWHMVWSFDKQPHWASIYTRHCAEHFTFAIAFNLYNFLLIRWFTIIICILRVRKWGPQKLRNFSEPHS